MNCVRSEHVEHRITRIQLGLIHFPEASPDLDNLQLSVAHFLHFLHIDVTRSQIESEEGKIETEWSHLTMTAPGRSPGGASKACQRIRRASQLSHGVGDDGAPEKHVRVLNLCKRFFFLLQPKPKHTRMLNLEKFDVRWLKCLTKQYFF